MTHHVLRIEELTKDEITLLLRCVYVSLDAHLIDERRKELLHLMQKLEYEYLDRVLDEPVE